ncbi:hypothetical protein [Acanthamoeba polyphaga mimivirus]|nr:hypothetical protein [Acanthamoeba castellanii mamavirus]UMZ08486.1 hypothetical protein [Acanthamoeba polyphaga mimivirus]
MNTEDDFIEPAEHQLELTYQRGQRLHGDTKKTVRQLAGRKPTFTETKKRRSDRKRAEKITQQSKLRQRQVKIQTLNLSVRKCDDKDVVKVKDLGYIHVSRTILNNTMFSDSEDEKFEDESWGGWFNIEPTTPESDNDISTDWW